MVQKKDIAPICVITGPTASGKSTLAMEAAVKTGGEIISCDSMQIYKHMDIGTAKPTNKDRAEIRHHMIDVAEPYDDYSVSLYRDGADAAISEITERGNKIYLTGGTGLYIKTLLYKTSLGNAPKDENIRARLTEILKEHGNEYLYDTLKKNDPKAAGKLHYNDTKRVIRALEIAEITNTTKTEVIKGDEAAEEHRYPHKIYVLNPDRAKLYNDINARVEIMIKDGLFGETENLLKYGCNPSMNSMKAIGYAESIRYLNGELKKEDAIRLIQQKTRNYAKRQMTFFRGFKNAVFLPITEIGIKKCLKTVL